MLKIATVVFWSALSLGVDATEPKSAATYEPPAQQEANKTESPKQPPEAPKEDASNATPKREQEQQHFGQRFGDFTLTDALLATFTGVLIAVGYLQWKALGRSVEVAGRATEVSEQTLVAAQRPWIQVKLLTAGPLVFGATPEDQEARVDLAFLIRNVGNSPAVRISLHAKLTISNTIDLRTEQRVYSEGIRESREQAVSQPNVIQPEITLFPGDQFPIQVVAYMNAEPLAKFREWAATRPGAIIFPAIVGSVFYEFTFTKGHHQTGIIYAIHKRTPYPDGHPLPGYARIPPGVTPITNAEGAIHLEGAIPDSDLVLRQNIVGTGPID